MQTQSLSLLSAKPTDYISVIKIFRVENINYHDHKPFCRLYMVVCIGICFMSPLCLSTSAAKATRLNHIFRAFNIFVLIYQLSIWKKRPLFSRLIQWGNLLEAFQISLRMAERLLEAQLKPLGMAGEQL